MDITIRDTFEVSVPREQVAFMKKFLSMIGATVKKATKKTTKSSYECAIEDIKKGRVDEFASVDEMFDKLGIPCSE